MHLSPLLLPSPLGDADASIRARVFGPRVTPGAAASGGGSPTGAAGGDLSGTYPSPIVVPDNASLLLAHRAFLPHVAVINASQVQSGILPVARGGTGANLSVSSGGAFNFVRQSTFNGPFDVSRIAAADLSAAIFVAAGASHAAGAVPDPGATAHPNQPYYPGDDAAWHKPLGRLLAVSSVSTDESTPSASFVDLATADTITFSVDGTSDVLIEYTCEFYNTGINNCNLQIMLDGTAQTATNIVFQATVANAGLAGHLDYVLTGLAAGSHTVKMQHAVSGGTGHWKVRTLRAWLAG
jgi:hypothetical protein